MYALFHITCLLLYQQKARQEKNINEQLFEEVSLSRSEIESRRAAVKVETPRGHGSGTYVIISQRRVVITAAHVIRGFSQVHILGEGEERVEGSVIFIDPDNDFAIISLSELSTRTPVRFVPMRKNVSRAVGDNVCYSGFPNGHDLLTIRGSVAGLDRGYILLQSYAWMGASGSGVFNDMGEFVGVLVAVDVGFFNGSPQIVESMVWIVPIKNIDTRLIRSVIEEKIPL